MADVMGEDREVLGGCGKVVGLVAPELMKGIWQEGWRRAEVMVGSLEEAGQAWRPWKKEEL